MSSLLLTGPFVVPSVLTKGSASTCGRSPLRSGEGEMLSDIRARVGGNGNKMEGGGKGGREWGEGGGEEEGEGE